MSATGERGESTGGLDASTLNFTIEEEGSVTITQLSQILRTVTHQAQTPAYTNLDKILPLIPIFEPEEGKIWEHLDDLEWILKPFNIREDDWRRCLVHSLSKCPRRETLEEGIRKEKRENVRPFITDTLAPKGFRTQLEAQIFSLRPNPGESVERFLDRFSKLARYAEVDLSSPRLTEVILEALTPTTLGPVLMLIADELRKNPAKETVDKFHLLFGKQIPVPAATINNLSAGSPFPSPASSSSTPATPDRAQERDRRRKLGLCLYCGASDHMIRDCTATPPCPHCKQKGHPARSCPIKPSGTYVNTSFTKIGKAAQLKVYTTKGQMLNAMLDTGAEPMALCDEEGARILGGQTINIPPTRILSADSREMSTTSRGLQTHLWVAGVRLPVTAIIVPRLATRLILGTPFLEEAGLTISFKKNEPPAISVAQIKADSKAPATPTLPPEIEDFKELFEAGRAGILPKNRPEFDLPIEIVDGATLPDSKLYKLSSEETSLLDSYIKAMLERGMIRPSSSPTGAGVFFVKKKDGTLRLCVDYRAINSITKKNRFPIPLIDTLFDTINRSGARVFSSLDLKAGYHLLRVRPGDEHLTAFKTPFGLFEYRVVPFGLANAPSAFQSWMTSILGDLVGKVVVVYVDDILIFTKTRQEHEQVLREVLKRLEQHQVVLNINKCQFFQEEVQFVGFRLSAKGLAMEEGKRQTIADWQLPRTKKGLQSFLGFANFYRNFIEGFANLASPLYQSLTHTHLVWDENTINAFRRLKDSFQKDVHLAFPNFTSHFIITGDCSDFALGLTLAQSQIDPNTLPPTAIPPRTPVAFYSRKLSKAEANLDTPDKETLPIVQAVQTWRAWLLSSQQPIWYFTDHKNLDRLTEKRKLTRKLARWLNLLADFDLRVVFTPRTNLVPEDAMSKREEFKFSTEESRELLERPMFKRNENNQLIPNNPTSLSPSQASISQISTLDLSNILEEIRVAAKGTSLPKDVKWDTAQNLPLYKGRIFVPWNQNLYHAIFQLRHDLPLASHPGIKKTYLRIKELFYWPQMRKTVEEYVRSCHVCQTSKIRRIKRQGLLVPIPASINSWVDIGIDFVTGLPKANGFDGVMVTVCRFSKMAHFSPISKAYNGKEVARLFLQDIVRNHGVPKTIISDRDKVFTSHFWDEVSRFLGFKPQTTTSRHPEADGQVERTNQTLEQLIRTTCPAAGLDWPRWLPMIEFAYNSAVTESTGFSPFEMIYGKNPNSDFALDRIVSSNPDAEALRKGLTEIYAIAKENLERCRERMKRCADRKRQDAPKYKIGDLVLLDRREIPSKLIKTKIDKPFLGPFVIIKILSNGIKLKLPDNLRIHPTFHVSQIVPYVLRPGSKLERSDNSDIQGEPGLTQRIPDRILRHRKMGSRNQFLVRCSESGAENDVWTFEENVPKHLVEFFNGQRAESTQNLNPAQGPIQKPLANPDMNQPEYWERLYAAKPLPKPPQFLPKVTWQSDPSAPLSSVPPPSLDPRAGTLSGGLSLQSMEQKPASSSMEQKPASSSMEQKPTASSMKQEPPTGSQEDASPLPDNELVQQGPRRSARLAERGKVDHSVTPLVSVDVIR